MTAASEGHALLDIGGAARLERFGQRVVDRPAPGALGTRERPDLWLEADLRFERERGWSGPAAAADGPWAIDLDGLSLELRPTEAGQVGLFPEHAAMLPWLRDQVAERRGRPADSPPQVLHLFAYTGLATLALAVAGAAVTHVDASRPTVTWARRNAERSGLVDRPVRWIVDDALGFANRELRRGRRYMGVVLDPPTYGHGPAGGDWRIEDDLQALLAAVTALLEPDGFLLLTAHTPDLGPEQLAGSIRSALQRPPGSVDAGDLYLATGDGRRLDLGAFARSSGRS